MTNLEKFRASPAWDHRHDLPLCPQLNNPWIYCAYALKLCHSSPWKIPKDVFNGVYIYAEKTNLPNGTHSRWPGSTDLTSHDEIIGICWMFMFVDKCLPSIKPFGFYETRPGPLTWKQKMAAWVPRFPWMIPFMRACALRENILDHLIWSACLLVDAINPSPTDAGGRLRWWIQFDAFYYHWLSKRAIHLWVKRHKQKGITLKSMLAIEPGEYPVFAECAPDEWV